jgi:anti-sigma regulatory factor (Ser/Thr protein kinase)
MEKRVLIARWLGPYTYPIPIYDEASVSTARQRVREIGQQLNLSKEVVESVALIASEVTHNQLSHAKHGYFAAKPIEREGVKGLEVIAADIGPGIKRPKLAIQDDMSTAGTLGAGVGAVCRIADEVAFDNRIEEGLCVVARKFEQPPAPRCCEIAIMGRPYPGEAISGDDAAFFDSDSMFMAAVADGMGHGPEARQASNRAIEGLSQKRGLNLEEIVSALNQELSGTHGCAMSIIRFEKKTGMAECVSLGDVHAHLYHLKDAHFFTATPLVLTGGQFQKQRIRVEKVVVQPGSVLVIFTDGLKSRTSLKGQLDVLRQPPIAIAEHLLENDSRPDDDALVLVARFPRQN